MKKQDTPKIYPIVSAASPTNTKFPAFGNIPVAINNTGEMLQTNQDVPATRKGSLERMPVSRDPTAAKNNSEDDSPSLRKIAAARRIL